MSACLIETSEAEQMEVSKTERNDCLPPVAIDSHFDGNIKFLNDLNKSRVDQI